MSGMRSKISLNFYDKTHFWGVVTLIVIVTGLIVDTTKAGSDNNNFYTNIIRLDNVATRIHQNYVEEISSEELIDNAINGMIGILDPHTSFFKEKDYEELRIHTEGKFGGLGIQISIRDKVLTVMTPISGTPASRSGIQSGDQIIEIDGKSTKDITIDAAVAKLRGEPGSDVAIKIRRKGEAKLLEYTITREIITINSVPFKGVLENNIGYISLLTFSQDAGDQVQKSIKELLEKNIKGLILDIRHNPGGLLPQAKEVSEKFIDKKKLIVQTRGRVSTQNKDFKASSNPVLPKDIPLIVLVDAASASASEIVAGAIQDWDRGVVLGDTTFGKGSVQSILPLDKEHHLKLTTAFYYTPSGRCINKPENDIRGSGNEEEDNEDSLAVENTVEYKTNNGRTVYGSGGIIPDTIVEGMRPEPVIRSLFIKDVFFKFANLQYPKLQKRKVTINKSFTIDKNIMKDFYSFLDSIDFEYKSYTKIKFDEFKDMAGFVKDTTEDSLKEEPIDKPEWTVEDSTMLLKVFSEVESILSKENKRAFAESDSTIKRFIREAILIRGLGSDNEMVYRSKLANDRQVLAAIGLLSDSKKYNDLLLPAGKVSKK